MVLRVVEIDTFVPGAQTSASLQIATLKDKFSFQHLWRHCVGAGKRQREGGGERLCSLWMGEMSIAVTHSEWNVQIDGYFFFPADNLNLWLFWAQKIYSGNVMFVLVIVEEIIVEKTCFLVCYRLWYCYMRYLLIDIGQLIVCHAIQFCINEYS